MELRGPRSEAEDIPVAQALAVATAPDGDPAPATDLPGAVPPIAAVPSSSPRITVPLGAGIIISVAIASGIRS